MTTVQIRAKQSRQNTQFDVAAEIRAVLDEAKDKYDAAFGEGSWEADDIESEAIALVTDDE